MTALITTLHTTRMDITAVAGAITAVTSGLNTASLPVEMGQIAVAKCMHPEAMEGIRSGDRGAIPQS